MNANRVIKTLGFVAAGGSMAFAVLLGSPAAHAATSPVDTAKPAIVVAAQAGPQAAADRPAAITVTDHGGAPVTLTAKGEKVRTASKPVGQAATFSGLTLGKPYTVKVGGEFVGVVTPVTTPGAASRLVVSATELPGEVTLAWKQAMRPNTGALTYRVTASSPDLTPIEATVSNGGTLSGLATDARYTFTVTPLSSAGAGKAARATMVKSLRELGAPSADSTAPLPPKKVASNDPGSETPTPATSQPTPTQPSTPRTRTIWVCPDGYSPAGDVCQKTAAYTYSTLSYTYHPVTRTWTETVIDGAEPMGDTWRPGCADGWCITASHQETRSETTMVKDATPSGYTDTGSNWSKKDNPPAGYTDDGSQWVTTAAKIATEVPA
jgi:hypothetical protein